MGKRKTPVAAVDNSIEVPVASSSAMPVQQPGRQIDVEGFVRVRDSVYSRLISIQNLLQTFSADYLRQTNLLLGLGEGTGLENAGEFAALDMGMGMGMSNIMPALPMPVIPGEEPKKERKKRMHDPNAPKRPLTPYFLYMQTARPIIANDLGADAAKGAVQEEGQRRWSTMSGPEKAGWDQAYQYNLRLYNARVHSYKHGNPEAKEMSDHEALQYAEANSIPMPTGKDVAAASAADAVNDHDAIAQQLQGAVVAEPEPEEVTEEAGDDDNDNEQPSSPPVAKTPKAAAKKGTKRKSAAAAEIAAAEAAVLDSGKKRRRQSKAPVEEKVEPEPKKSGRSKKSKSG